MSHKTMSALNCSISSSSMHPKDQKGELQILGCESNRIVDNNTRIEQPTMDERDWQL